MKKNIDLSSNDGFNCSDIPSHTFFCLVLSENRGILKNHFLHSLRVVGIH